MNNPLEAYPLISAFRTGLEEDLKSTIRLSFSSSYQELQDMLAYHMGWMDDLPTGKRIRPILLLLVTQLLGGDWNSAIPAASAIELIHNFSLIHDDIQDRSEMRHGRLTLWKTSGVAQAINAGDALFTIGLKKIWDLQKTHDIELVARTSLILNQTCLRLTEGQYLDIRFETQPDVTEREYLEMIAGKTTVLISACTQIGAMVSGASPQQVLSAVEYGQNLGLAFQIIDDYLGVWGDASVTGKSIASDLVDGKKSYPILLGLQSDNVFSRRWKTGSIREDEARSMADLLAETGAKQATIAKADEYTSKAMNLLGELGEPSEVKTILTELTHWLLRRDS